jgi:DNA polymerase-3 subunit epsilon
VRQDEIVDAVSRYTQPPAPHDEFVEYNIKVHGIGPDAVATAPTFLELLPEIVEYVGSDIVCAHNARFDHAVLDAAAKAVGSTPPRFRYLCTQTAAKRCLQLPRYSLPYVASALGVRLPDHHGPGGDSLAVALVVPALAARLNISDLEEMIAVTQAAPSTASRSDSDQSQLGENLGHPLEGRVIVFTGTLSSMTRDQAHEECVHVGAHPGKTVTARTNVLVAGDQDPNRLVPGAVLSQKAQDAFDRRENGQDIEVMTEYDFLQAL